MPVQATDIDQEIDYILTYWIQNNNQLITGTIGQNVVWNLAQFIKQNPENYKKATVVASNSNYTTNKNQCVLIFTNNSSGGLDWVDNRWNKYYFVNSTNNSRLFLNGKGYYGINGVFKTSLTAYTSVVIAKGDDDFWYEVSSVGIGTNGFRYPLIGVAGDGGINDPVVGSSIFESLDLVGIGVQDGKIRIFIDDVPMSNIGQNKSFDFDNTIGLIDLREYTFGDQSSIWIDLNQ